MAFVRQGIKPECMPTARPMARGRPAGPMHGKSWPRRPLAPGRVRVRRAAWKDFAERLRTGPASMAARISRHQPLVVVQVVHGAQHRAPASRCSGPGGAGRRGCSHWRRRSRCSPPRSGAGRCSYCALRMRTVPAAGEEVAVARVAGRHHAVEHVHPARHRLDQVLGRAHAHQVARLVRGQRGRGVRSMRLRSAPWARPRQRRRPRSRRSRSRPGPRPSDSWRRFSNMPPCTMPNSAASFPAS